VQKGAGGEGSSVAFCGKTPPGSRMNCVISMACEEDFGLDHFFADVQIHLGLPLHHCKGGSGEIIPADLVLFEFSINGGHVHACFPGGGFNIAAGFLQQAFEVARLKIGQGR